jgi:curved DNA-binding protein CbpA
LPDFYATLELTQKATPDSIKESFRRLARRYHPDIAGANAANTARMVELNKAYETLRDPRLRAVYDQQRVRIPVGAGYGPYGSAPTPPRTQQPQAGPFDVLDFLRRQRLEYVDKRNAKGALWIVGGPELKPVMDQLKKHGLRFTYSEKGGRATQKRPAWWGQ